MSEMISVAEGFQYSVNIAYDLHADGRVRTVAEIAEETGIPEGASSGKVRPHIQYASYMGLLNSSDFTRTPLGKIVYLEDCMLTEKLTQMLCHVNMISPTGAPMWRYLFHELFPENQGHISNGLISDSMKIKFGATAKFAPLITMYTKQFTELNLISLEGDYIIQNPSAFDKDLLYVYGYANILNGSEVNEDFSLTFFKTLAQLNELDIRILRCYAGYMGDGGESVQDICENTGIDYTQVRFVKEKLSRYGLLQSRNEEINDKNMESMVKYMQDVERESHKSKPKDVKVPKLKKPFGTDSYSITMLGRRYLALMQL